MRHTMSAVLRTSRLKRLVDLWHYSHMRSPAIVPLLIAAAFTAVVLPAQENMTSPPPPLQFPTVASANAKGVLIAGEVRALLEEAGNVELCKIFMKQDDPGVSFPDNFAFKDCSPSATAKVRNGDGDVRWADGARPTQCKRECLGSFTMDQTRALDRPNRRFASARGRLTFTVDQILDRDIIFGFEMIVDCRVASGSKSGEIAVNAVVDQPFSDGPGLAESILDFLTGPANLSRRIDDRIRAALRGAGATPALDRGRCTSIGATGLPEFTFDQFNWDIPPPPAPPKVAPATALRGRTATLFIDSITRKKTIERSPLTDPLRFKVYLNGSLGSIPPFDTVSLAPGETHAKTYCKTVNVESSDNLQVLFVDSLGGAVWSQFPRSADFGNGPSRTMTTGRQIFRLPQPVPGVSTAGGGKPQLFILREFELRYRIVFEPRDVISTAPAVGGIHVGTGHPVVSDAPAQTPCIKI
jgi:hypothetical protein